MCAFDAFVITLRFTEQGCKRLSLRFLEQGCPHSTHRGACTERSRRAVRSGQAPRTLPRHPERSERSERSPKDPAGCLRIAYTLTTNDLPADLFAAHRPASYSCRHGAESRPYSSWIHHASRTEQIRDGKAHGVVSATPGLERFQKNREEAFRLWECMQPANLTRGSTFDSSLRDSLSAGSRRCGACPE